jgi:hypothetical protein
MMNDESPMAFIIHHSSFIINYWFLFIQVNTRAKMPIDISGTSAILNTRAGLIKNAFNTTLKQDFVSMSRFTTVRTAGTYTAPNIQVGDFIQAYQGAFTPKNQVNISAETLELQEMKVDILWTEVQLNSFLKKWKPQNSQFGDTPLNNKFFSDFLMMNYVYPKMLSELETKLIFKGKYMAPVAGQPGVTMNACDGLKERIITAHSAGNLTYIPVGAITPSNIYDKTVLYCRSMPEPEQEVAGEVECSRQYLEMFADAVYEKGKTVIDPRTLGFFNEYPIPGTTKKLKCYPAQSGNMGLIYTSQADNKIILLPSSDMKEEQQYEDVLPVINWETSKRELYGWGNFQMAVGFEYGANMFVSDTIEL